MLPCFHHRRSSRWPFWLLIAAWVCANTPAIAVFTLLAWLGEARHFSHQQRLVTDVAFVLTGNEAPGLGLMVAVKNTPKRAALPAVPTEIESKKLDLAVERTVEVRPPIARENSFLMGALVGPEALREPPPHQPPRISAMS